MFAKNPKTGKPIRIMRSDASVWRSEKTLVWLQNQEVSVPWDRWETLAVGVPDIQKWESVGKQIDYVVLADSEEDSVNWYISAEHAKYKMIFIPMKLVYGVGEARFRSMHIPNVIVLEEMHRMYPFIGDEWDGTREDAALLMGVIMRMASLSGYSRVETNTRVEHLKRLSINFRFLPVEEKPKELWYITQYYRPEKGRRAKEIRKCLDMNISCNVIDKLVLLNEKDFSSDYPKNSSHKIRQEIIGERLTYKSVIQWIYNNVPDDVICVFANADIFLDQAAWRDIWSVKLDDVFMALLRWDVQEDESPSKVFGPRNDSQDTWCLLSNSVKSRTWDYESINIPFGKAGCDNAITIEMLRKKFLVVNPAMTLKTHHLQNSGVRTYDSLDVVDRPAYLYVDPTGIHDMEPVFDLTKYVDTKVKYERFTREMHAAQARVLDTYCKMLERGERYFWSSKDTNTFQELTVPMYKYNNVFQTPQGLIYGYNKLYIGKEEASKDAWSKSNLSPITPAYKVKRSFAVPWRDEQVKSNEGYALYYLSKILWMRSRYGEGEFWAHGVSSSPILELFRWGNREVPVVPHSKNAQIWSDEAIQYPYNSQLEITKEDIDILRKGLRTRWVQEFSAEKTRWVVMVDGSHITTDMVREWESVYPDYDWAVIYESRTSPDRILEKLSGAAGLVCYGGPNSIARWGFSWMLPQGATVIEIQNEMQPDGEACHVSGAAGLRHVLAIVPRASEAATRAAISKNICLNIEGWKVHMQKKDVVEESLPVIRMPRKDLTGFFAHAGDSFREMVRLWEEKGYVRIVEDGTNVQIWLGEVGDVLLYDRPSMDWLFASPPQEQKWKKALFGNPKPSISGGGASSWFFWPRRPRYVEEIVEKGLPARGWDDRTKNLVFYGKIENKVQEKRRVAQDWSVVCDEYVCVKGEETKYPFTQYEYLENLTAARFGLCLAGFGKKCHREVECMAMGCVPVVSGDVDMENYANPPKEGIHYLRVETPEEAKEKVSGISKEQWCIMSEACRQWWRENASVEGSWRLTQKLR